MSGTSRGPSVSNAGDQAKGAATKKPTHPRLVSQLPYTTLSKLSSLLDTSRDGSQLMWRKLIEEMPHLKYNVTTVEKFALNVNQPNGSPSYALLTDMSNRGITYDELITGLKKLNFHTALTAIGHREAVNFTVQPEAVPASLDQTVVLECEATGVPKPSYLWFKGREPLPEYTTCRLCIDKVRMEDAGMYICRASNEVNIVFSSWAEIKVNRPKVLRPETQVLPGNQEITASPQILQAPSGEYQVYVNEELRLVVVANAPQELTYQWFRDSHPLPYSTGNELYIKQVQVVDQGVYNCRVSTKLGGSKLTDDCMVHVLMPQDGGGGQQVGMTQHMAGPTHQQQPMGPGMGQHHTAMQQQVNGNFYHHGNQGGPPPMGGPGGIPPQGIPGMMYTHPPGPGSVDTPSTHMTELITSPAGSHASQFTGMMSPAGNVHTGFVGGDGGVNMGRPHDLPIHTHGYHNYHHGNIEDTSNMYHNSDAPVGEQIEYRQPPFTVHGGEDLLGGQGELRPNLNEPCYDKVALLIGNKNYRQSTLKLNTPENDAQDLAGVLRSADFKVVSLVNLNKMEMEKALQYFASLLGKNVYALFFFAGHGFELNNMNYMMAVDADVEKRTDQCICAQQVLHTMQSRGAKLSIVLLDMCRVNASTPMPPRDLQVLPQPKGTNGYFVIGFSCSPAERAFEAGTSPEGFMSDNKYKDNSIFVAAFREHLQQGTLNKRIDNLLTDSAAGVRLKGQQLQQYDQWQKPEVRSNLGEDLKLNDPIKMSREIDSERQQRTLLWQKAHTVPDSVVVSCHGDERNGVKPGEVAFRLHFEAEHSNVLVVTAELLTGCLTPVEIISVVRMNLVTDYNPDGPRLILNAENDKQYKFSERSKYTYGHQQGGRNNDLLHFKIPDIQKIKSQQVVLEMEVQYENLVRVPGEGTRQKTCIIQHSMNPPLYAQVLTQQLKSDHAQLMDYNFQYGHTHMQPTPT